MDDAPIGERALAKGWITAEQLREAVGAQEAEAREGRPRRPLGAVLVERRFLSGAKLAVLIQERKTEPAATTAAPEPPSPSPIEGPRVGRYVRGEPLGAGGMADVFRAWDTGLRRWVALKILRAMDEEPRRRFLTEARAAARLSHPGIVPVYDFGEADGTWYIAMGLVEGRALDEVRPEPREAARIVRDAAVAVGAAHRGGVLHRDLKPGNILLDAEGAVHVMDFGLARDVSAKSTTTVPGTVLGTPRYAPPEQLQGALDRVDARSDVYSLGATLYEMLAGRPAFEAPTLTQVIEKAIRDDPVPPRDLRPGVEPDLQWICLKAMEKESARRYPTAEALAEDLDRFLRTEPIRARPPSAIYRVRRALARRASWIAGGAIAAAGIAAVVLILASAARGGQARRLMEAGRERLDAAVSLSRRADATPEEISATLERAEADLDASLSMRPQAAALVLRGRVRTEQLRLDEAERDFDEALRSAPGDPAALLGRARLRVLRLRLAVFTVGSRADWDGEIARRQAGAVEAIRALEGLTGTALPTADRLLAEAFVKAYVHDDPTGALADLEEAAARSIDADLFAEIGAIYRSIHGQNRAEDALTEALRVRPKYFVALLARGIVRSDLGRWSEAAEDLTAAIALAPHMPVVWFARGLARSNAGDLDGGESDYHEALRRDPRFLAAEMNLAGGLIARGRYREAIDALDALAARRPDLAEPVQNRGIARAGLGEFQDAVADFDEALRIEPGNLVTRHNRGLALGSLGRFDEAIEEFDAVLEAAPGSPDTLVGRGKARLMLGNPAGMADLDEAIRINPDHVDGRTTRAVYRYGARDFDGALEDFDRVVRVDPGNAIAHCNRASTLASLGRYEEAVGGYDEAIRLQDDYWDAYLGRGKVKAMTGDPAGAAADLRRALAIASPEWPGRAECEAFLRQLEAQIDPEF